MPEEISFFQIWVGEGGDYIRTTFSTLEAAKIAFPLAASPAQIVKITPIVRK